jgi:hypothetical protein
LRLAPTNASLSGHRLRLAPTNASLSGCRFWLAPTNAGLFGHRLRLASTNASLFGCRFWLASTNTSLFGCRFWLALTKVMLKRNTDDAEQMKQVTEAYERKDLASLLLMQILRQAEKFYARIHTVAGLKQYIKEYQQQPTWNDDDIITELLAELKKFS